MKWKLEDLEDALLIGSTLVEGSTLTEQESREILAGRTVLGHPISEARELLNYRSAVEWLIHELQKSPYVSIDLIQSFHQKLFTGFSGDHGKWKSIENYTFRSDGSRFDYVSPSKVQTAMQEWIKLYNRDPHDRNQIAELYYSFQSIHPFQDGNGRIGRVLMAYWLHWKFKSLFTFKLKDKVEHLRALEAANSGDLSQLERFFKKRISKE
ncbi:MAG: Fic family protein [Xanthomonadaceae bacterium]|nr:Fic family protein [Xanthomonadaceae bacterium]